jgi:hypothetical protein
LLQTIIRGTNDQNTPNHCTRITYTQRYNLQAGSKISFLSPCTKIHILQETVFGWVSVGSINFLFSMTHLRRKHHTIWSSQQSKKFNCSRKITELKKRERERERDKKSTRLRKYKYQFTKVTTKTMEVKIEWCFSYVTLHVLKIYSFTTFNNITCTIIPHTAVTWQWLSLSKILAHRINCIAIGIIMTP